MILQRPAAEGSSSAGSEGGDDRTKSWSERLLKFLELLSEHLG